MPEQFEQHAANHGGHRSRHSIRRIAKRLDRIERKVDRNHQRQRRISGYIARRGTRDRVTAGPPWRRSVGHGSGAVLAAAGPAGVSR
ncbi:hypothetical protein [Nocardia sp. NPDC059239]|uniref:hypothetical protein n=1 Tax=Nocardia sp. NPDC059239 TaxID=3346785 RepID=UPI0036AC7B4D